MLTIGEFSKKCSVTKKALRYYDEIGLLKPECVDDENGYRMYSENQEILVNWIRMYKNIGFSLDEIKLLISGNIDTKKAIDLFKLKRVEIADEYNIQVTRKMQIDRLINFIEKEGYDMEEQRKFIETNNDDMREFFNSIPDTAAFIERAEQIKGLANGNYCMIQMDLWHFKSINDEFGFTVGDKFIAAAYQTLLDSLDKNTENWTLARSGGDEFLAFFQGERHELQKVYDYLLSSLDIFDTTKIGVTSGRKIDVYMGASITSHDTETIEQLINKATSALYEAKNIGKNALYVNE